MFADIPECTTWQCINSFALWISSIGTVLISAVSLYVSYKAFSYTRSRDVPRIAIEVTTGIISNSGEPFTFLGLEVSNIGHRKVIITGYSWEFKELFRSGKQLISYISKNKYTALSDKIPFELDEGRKASFFNPLDLFANATEFYEGATYFGVWYRVHTLKVRITCTTFTKRIKLNRGIRSMIWSQYKSLLKSS